MSATTCLNYCLEFYHSGELDNAEIRARTKWEARKVMGGLHWPQTRSPTRFATILPPEPKDLCDLGCITYFN